MNCKNLKYRIKKGQRYIYCKHKNQIITFSECRNCPYKEYKQYKPIKKRTYKQAKREKERFSIIYQDLSKCCVCGSIYGIELNEIYEGSYRQRSILYGMVNPLCNRCHKRFHNDSSFNLYFKVLFQKEFMKNHSLEEFINLFGQDYIYKQKKVQK